MGSSASIRINEYQKIEADLKLTTLPDLDKLLIVAEDLLKVTEQLRSRIVLYIYKLSINYIIIIFNIIQTISYHDLMLRIVKLQSYKDVTLIDSFRIWFLCTLVCNDSKKDSVKFQCKIENFDQEVASETLKKLMNFGSVVAFAIEDKFVQDENEQLIICDTGICGDFKLQLWPFILSSFLSYLRSAWKLAPFLEEKINCQINLIRKYYLNSLNNYFILFQYITLDINKKSQIIQFMIQIIIQYIQLKQQLQLINNQTIY